MTHIYADHAATTPVHPEVVAVMTDVLTNEFGNASSIHAAGRRSRQLLDEARTAIARSINAPFNDIVFTSGGTESNNMAIYGVAEAMKEKGRHIITSAVEHHAVLHPCEKLAKSGYDVTFLPVDENGLVSVRDVKAALRDDTILVTIMYGNNEVGTIQPIHEIAALLDDHQAVFHTDAVQAYGYETIDVQSAGIDLLSVSGHKINGPKGIGFLYIKNGTPLSPGMLGGEQERKRRAGTENVASVVALAKAVQLMQENREQTIDRLGEIKETLVAELTAHGIAFDRNGSLEHTLPHVLNLSVRGVDVEAMLVNLDLAGIFVSSGSACTAGSIEPSHVLLAMFGPDSERLRNAIRFSFGLGNTVEDAKKIAAEVAAVVKRLTA